MKASLLPNICAAALIGALAVRASSVPDAGNKDTPGKSIGIASVTNLRDIGDYKTRNGLIVRTKLLYRSNQLCKISPGDFQKVAALGLKNDYDMRTADERESAPDEVPPGVKVIWLNVLADSRQAAPAIILKHRWRIARFSHSHRCW